jgi:hypothetical protein
MPDDRAEPRCYHRPIMPVALRSSALARANICSLPCR